MALNAATIWGVKTTGNNANGGGWNDTGGASVDYSENDAPILSVGDAVANGTATVTSATGGFTAAMVGSIVNIVTKGRFQITVLNSGNSVDVDRNVVAGSGLTANVGGAVADLDEIDSIAIKGNTIHVKAGTYTPGAIVFATSDNTTRIQILGYNASRNDQPTGDNRPLLACGANGFDVAPYNWIKHFRMTTTHAFGMRVNTLAVAVNCKVENTGANATDKAYRLDQGRIIDCEAISGNGMGIYFYLTGRAIGCYVHDCNEGINLSTNADYSVIEFNIIDTIAAAGIFADGIDNLTLIHNTIYNADKGVDTDGNGAHWVIMNNQFVSNTTYGVTIDVERKDNYVDYNNWYNNGTDVLNLTKGPNATADDPGFADAAGGNFSDVDDANAFGIRLGVG